MIDTHAHIRNKEDIRIEGLMAVVLSGANVEDSKANLELAKTNKIFYPAVGVHPQEMVANIDATINELDRLAVSAVAIGECGLDFSAEHDRRMQEILFRGQIAIALKHKRPLIVHSRKAPDETLAILADYKELMGVIHCYSGGIKRIKKVLQSRIDNNNEFYFGIDGNLTYEEGLQEVVRNIPKDRLLLETDSPELTPVPHRGKKNYPEYVKYIYQKTADIWETSFEDTEKQIDDNAKRLFGVV